MALRPAWRSLSYPAADAALEQPAPFYRFYPLRADGHIARLHEDYLADDAAAIAVARHVMGDYPGVEIWCERRKVVTLSREEAGRLQPPVAARSNRRAALLISRNKRLLQQATATSRCTDALRARPTGRGGAWAKVTWQQHDEAG
jgi:hypothetical protein